jgi:hypothetical protein
MRKPRGRTPSSRDQRRGLKAIQQVNSSLLDHLAQLADPRHRRGRRHALGAVLAVAVAAVRLARSDITAA